MKFLHFHFRLRVLLESGNLYLHQLTHYYRTQQLLGIMMNDVQQKALLTVSVISAIILGSVGGAVSVTILKNPSSYPNKDFVLAFLLVVISASDMTLVFVIGSMGHIYVGSKEFLAALKNTKVTSYYSNQEQKLLTRYGRSFMPIKAMFGSLNFIETSTPLTCIQFTNDLMVQFLLLVQ